MRRSDRNRNFLAILIMGLLLLIASPTSFGQDRNRGRDRDWNNNWSRNNKKCGKFVNCHNARDGRWDRRGARGDRVGYTVWRNRNRNRSFNRNQNYSLQRRVWARRQRNLNR